MSQQTPNIEHILNIKQIILSSSALFFNLLVFLIFYFSPKKRNSILGNLMMWVSLCECICFYIMFVMLMDFDNVEHFLKVKTILRYITNSNHTERYYFNESLRSSNVNASIPEDVFMDTTHIKDFTLYKINMSFYSASLTASLIFNILCCVEVICIFRYPISDSSKRRSLYYIVSIILSLASYLLSYFYFIESSLNSAKETKYTKDIEYLWDSQNVNLLLYVIFMVIGMVSIFYSINILKTQSKIQTKEKFIFCFRRTTYVLIYFLMWIYPFLELIFVDKYDIEAITYLFSLSGILASLFRLIELCNLTKICSCFSKRKQDDTVLLNNSNSLNKNENEIYLDGTMTTEYKNSALDKSVIDEKITVTHNDISLSLILSNSILIEYMFYVIQGILKIGKEINDKKMSPYLINNKSYSEIIYHVFDQIDINSIDDIKNASIPNIKSKNVTSTNRCAEFFSMFNICEGSISLKEYSPKIFRNILMLDNLEYFELFKSFEIEKNLENLSKLKISEGKSGSFFFFTYDNRFLIKTISNTELSTMLEEFQKPYYNLVTENFNTLLGRTYGVYTLYVGLTQITLILMENISPIDNSEVFRRFDLKGSLVGRKTDRIDMNNKMKTLKDIDFLDFKRIYPDLINFEIKNIINLTETLKHDINLFRNSYIMDYSFFITICENKKNFDITKCLVQNRLYYSKDEKYIYFIGIIDYLTKFNSIKIIENSYKAMMNYSQRETISAVNPVLYSDRYAKFVVQEIFNLKN